MQAYLKLLTLLTLTAVAAFAASRVLVPNAVPVADSELPQWYFQLAFLLKSIELIGLGGIALVMIAGLSI
jgi:hypothetical protein